MNIKIFGVIALAVVIAVGWYYVLQNQPKIASTLPTSNTYSQISQINAMQTNPNTGKIEYQLTAESLAQNSKGDDELKHVVMNWIPAPNDHYTLQANVATMSKTTGEFIFGQGFILTRHATPTKPVLILAGDTLMGNTKTKQINSQTPLNITQGNNQFTARRMQADLNTGDYHFYYIQMQFRPPTVNN